MLLNQQKMSSIFMLLAACLFSTVLFAHGVDDQTKQFLLSNEGVSIIPFMYIGAKHMVTGYDHILFLVGVIFFLYRTKDVLIYVTLFTIGHSLTLMYGGLNDIAINAHLVDAIIGLSVIYKGFDNLGGFQKLVGFQPNTKIIVFIFGLFHGFGLASKIQEFELSKDGLMENLIAFNVGVELGQFAALLIVFLLLNFWRKSSSYLRFATITNGLLISCGVMLVGYQITDYYFAY